MRTDQPAENSATIRARVEAARTRQRTRFAGTPTVANAGMSQTQIKKYCSLAPALGDLLQHAMEELRLSARAYDRILKVARTIADLAAAERITHNHLLEAIQYRSLDRRLFY